MRVYPPLRSLYRSARSSKSFVTVDLFFIKAMALRLAATVPSFPRVIIFSAWRLKTLALGVVVVILPCSTRSLVMFESMDFKWLLVRSNRLSSLLCLMICDPLRGFLMFYMHGVQILP